jgi:hypothetical protein
MRRHVRNGLGLWGSSTLLLANACTLADVDSDAIRTQGMFADMLALAPGDGTTVVRVRLTVGGEGGTNVTLVGDDVLEARAGEVSERLEHSGNGRYQRTLGGDEVGEVSVELQRGPDDEPASGSALLPEPLMLELATDGSATIARSAPVTVTWSPPVDGGTVTWTVEGRCLWSESGAAPDEGVLTLGPESFRVRGSRAGDDCEVTLGIQRANVGEVDGIWVPGSRFRAVQQRAVAFISTPASDEALPETEPKEE